MAVSADVVVVGGGWAGLSAAVELTSRGARVCVLEAANVPGGRARSFRDRASGETLDSGQHLMLGAYSSTLSLLGRLGTERLVESSTAPVPLYGGGREGARVLSAPLPGPLHLLPSVAGMQHLGLRARLNLARVGVALTRSSHDADLDSMSARQWLMERAGQGSEAMRLFWDPVSTAMLNEGSRDASAKMLVAVLRQGILAGHRPSRPLLARVGLADLVGRPAVRHIEERGGEVRLACRVRGFEIRGSIVTAALTRTGPVRARVFVLAVPSWRVPGLSIPGASRRLLDAGRRLGFSPIVTVHLRYRRPIMDVPMAGLLGGRFHWLFDRGLVDPGPPPGLWSYAVVASAADGFVDQSRQEIVRRAIREIGARVASASPSLVESVRVLRHRRATFRAAVGSASSRPAILDSGLENLLLAGDWTDTGLPGTLEGAVRSGFACVEPCLGLLEGAPGVRQSTKGCTGARPRLSCSEPLCAIPHSDP
jgi:squalene-associated FAD-dependent desaturase